MDKFRIDGEKMSFHPARVAHLMEGKDDWEKSKNIFPLYVEVSPMGACNHRCLMCSVDFIGYKTIHLEHELYAERVAEMGRLGIKAIMLAGEGEPLLHKKINLMVSDTLNANIDVAFTTNGVLLDKLNLEGVSWVKVSINAGTKETYERVHQTAGKDWDRVWSNLRDAVKRRGNCTIGVQMVLLPENEREAEEKRPWGKSNGIVLVVVNPNDAVFVLAMRKYENY